MTPTEQQEAEALATWLRYQGYNFTHIPNETGSSAEARRRAVRMKRAGTSRGFPDYLIFAEEFAIAIELKRNSKSAKATKEQLEWLNILGKYGFATAVCHGFDEARQFVQNTVNKRKQQRNDFMDAAESEIF